MKRVQLTRAAARDLDHIRADSESGWGAVGRDAYMDRFSSAFARLAASPLMGPSVDDSDPDLRKWPVGSHVVFYRVVDEQVIVTRILHGRMDVPRRLAGS